MDKLTRCTVCNSVTASTASSLFLKASENKIKVKITMVDFQQQITQRLVDDESEHINSQNDRLDLRLNPL